MNKQGNHTTSQPITDWGKVLELIQRLESMEKYKLSLYITLQSYWGLRANEVLNLKWMDILEKDEVVVFQTKNQKNRVIPVHPFVKETIIRIYRLMKYPNPNNYFTRSVKYSTSNKPMSISYINKELKKWNRRFNMGLERISTHSLRKSMVRRVMSLSKPSEFNIRLVEVSKMLGHSTPSQTVTYCGIEKESLDNLYTNM